MPGRLIVSRSSRRLTMPLRPAARQSNPIVIGTDRAVLAEPILVFWASGPAHPLAAEKMLRTNEKKRDKRGRRGAWSVRGSREKRSENEA